MSDTLRIGSIIVTPQNRDAVHMAIIPMIAGKRLYPSSHVGTIDGKHAFEYDDRDLSVKSIGIVDPFLKDCVEKGQEFWLFLYPGSITSLRHDWTHPDLDFQCVDHVDRDADKEDEGIAISRKWIEDYANSLGLGYQELMSGAANHVSHDDYLSRGGLLEGIGTDPEFWIHYMNITGTIVDSSKADNFFSCSC